MKTKELLPARCEYVVNFFLWRFDPIPGHASFYGASRLHSLDTPLLVRLLWTNNQPVAETAT